MRSIYVVEDDANIREIEMFALKSGGYEAEGFERASDFWRAVKERRPSLILLDIMLPDEDGLAVLKKLRAGQETKGLPIILVTAKTTEIDKVRGLDAGADDYITKPFGVMELLSRVKALLRRAQIASERKIIIGSVVLDYDSFTVTKDGKARELPQKKFLLLYKLLSYPGKIFTRIQLMDEI